MPQINKEMTVQYLAWNGDTNTPETGDALNHILRVIADGDPVAPFNSPEEVDATNAPGVYRLTITENENNGEIMMLTGRSATDDVSIMPVQWSNKENVAQVEGGEAKSEISAALLESIIEEMMDLRSVLRIMLAALANLSSGGSTDTITFRDLANTKNRITATVTVAGDRTEVTLDPD